MSAGHFGQISLFLPLYAILELPYLHGARNLARRKVRILVHMTKGWTPLSFVFAPLAHPELFNFWCDPRSPPLHRMLLSAPSAWSSPR